MLGFVGAGVILPELLFLRSTGYNRSILTTMGGLAEPFKLPFFMPFCTI